MRASLVSFLFIFMSLQATAGSNLLDLLKAGKAKYSIGNCQSFIQQATHRSLKSSELEKLIIKDKDSKFSDGFYFHYTSSGTLDPILRSDLTDRKAAQAQIVSSGGYKSIMEYQMTYSDALSNVSGVGFYVAANPWSSTSYGVNQVTLKVNPDARVINYVDDKSKVDAIIDSISRANPLIDRCHSDLKLSLIMNENNVDLLYYNAGSEWFVAFNEDIFEESSIANTNTYGDYISPIVKKGYVAALIPYIKELNPQSSRNINLADVEVHLPKMAGKSGMSLLADSISRWDEGTAKGFAQYISTKSGVELQTTMADFKAKNRIKDSTYFNILLTNSSDDFLKYIGPVVKADPSLAKNWGSNYLANSAKLVSAGFISIDFLLANAGGNVDKLQLYTLYKKSGFEGMTSSLIKFMIQKDIAFFKTLSASQMRTILNDYLNVSKADEIPQFVDSLLKSGADVLPFVVNFRVNQSSASHFAFASELLKQNPDVKYLESSKMVNQLYVGSGFDIVTYMSAFKSNPKIPKNFADTFFEQALTVINTTQMDRIAELQKNESFSRSQMDKLLLRVLSFAGDYSTLVKKILLNARYTPQDARNIVTLNIDSSAMQNGLLLSHMMTDPVLWKKYLDLKNPEGIVKDITTAKRSHFLRFLYSNHPDFLYGMKFEPGLLTDDHKSAVFGPHVAITAAAQYPEEEKVKLLEFMLTKSFNQGSVASYIQTIKFNPQIVQKYGANLIKASSDKNNILLSLVNQKEFYQALSVDDANNVVTLLAAKGLVGQASNIIGSNSLTFEKAVQLALSLKNSDSSTYHDLKSKYFLWDDLDSAKQVFLAGVFLEKFNEISPFIRNDLWADVYSVLGKTGKDAQIADVGSSDKAIATIKADIQTYLMSSDARIKIAISAFEKNGSSFIEQMLVRDDATKIPLILSYIEKNYPVSYQYIPSLYRYRKSPINGAVVMEHFRNFSCKRVKGYSGFSDLITNGDRYYRDNYKAYKTEVCK